MNRRALPIALALATLLATNAVRAQTVPGDCQDPATSTGAVGALVDALGGVASVVTGIPPVRFRAGLRDCPPGTGFRPLSSVHAPKEVIVGSYPDPAFAKYAKEMTDAVGRLAPGVRTNVLVHPKRNGPGAPEGKPELFEFAREPGYADRVRLIEAKGFGQGVQWAQDGVEMGVTGADNKPAAIEFYAGMANDYSIVNGVTNATRVSGGQGGDVEAFPGGVVAVGSKTTADTKHILTEGSGDAPVQMDTSWLRIGHVDELFQVVPTGDGQCDFAIVHASPAAGLELLLRLPASAQIEPDMGQTRPVGEETFGSRRPNGTSACVDDLPSNGWGNAPLTAGAARACAGFSMINRQFEAKIQTDLAKLRQAVSAKTGCEQPKTIAIPQLFRPGGVGGRTGAESVNPNAVNAVVLGKGVIAGDQPNDVFRDEIRRRYQAAGIRVELIDARYFHFNGGTVHCSTNVVRSCS